MTDFQPEHDIPTKARRGQKVELTNDMGLEDPAESGEQDFLGLVAGDQILAKVTVAHPTRVGDGWMTYGASSHVLDGEDEPAAFERLATVVSTRALDLADIVLESIEDRVEEERANRGRIVPRNN